MKISIISPISPISVLRRSCVLGIAMLALANVAVAQEGLKDAIGKYCLIGAAVNQWQSDGQVPEADAVLAKHFNCVVAENCMKPEVLAPAEGIFDFRVADKFVNYAQQLGLKVNGHCLVWHSQAPDWWFTNGYTASPASKEVLKERLIKHIKTVVGHFKGQVFGWDVVNEAIMDDGSFRKSPYYNLLGEEFIEIAFRAAHEADPDAELYYNDYSMSGVAKREAVCRLVKNLKAKGIRIDGVGMQSHNGLDYPNLEEYEKSIDAFAACDVKVMITELDINVLPNPKASEVLPWSRTSSSSRSITHTLPDCLLPSRRSWTSAGWPCSRFITSTVHRSAASPCGASATVAHGSTDGPSRDVPTTRCSSTVSIRRSRWYRKS